VDTHNQQIHNVILNFLFSIQNPQQIIPKKAHHIVGTSKKERKRLGYHHGQVNGKNCQEEKDKPGS
ncbi:MAG: hypothetical protein ACI8RD_006850, partial [Bacillariaceae sp.]|jgi:hypothetical protein